LKIHINQNGKPIGTMDFSNHAILLILCPIREQQVFEDLRTAVLVSMLDHAGAELSRPCGKCFKERKLLAEPVGQVEECPACGDPAYNIAEIPFK
jgi:hypothetical protein